MPKRGVLAWGLETSSLAVLTAGLSSTGAGETDRKVAGSAPRCRGSIP